ncbi:MAG TPA: hypothetical protein VGM76_02865 [Lacipirellulaceae bacterium]|jgi:hypothetical protein
MHQVVLGLSVVFATLGSARAASFKTYAIGNSLTMNATLNAMDDMAAQVGISSLSSDHIYLGQSLNTIWTNPTHTDTPGSSPGVNSWPHSAGNFPTAFSPPATAWNAIVMEPFFSPLVGSTGDSPRILDFMNYASGKTASHTPPGVNPVTNPGNPDNAMAQYYIFARWSQDSSWAPPPNNPPLGSEGHHSGYHEAWIKSYVNGDGGNTTMTGDYFQKLLASVRAAQPTDIKPIELIPVGNVFDAIDQRINAGGLAGLGGSIANLYAPDSFGNLHLNTLGRFVATTTFYSTIFAKDPSGMVPPPADYPGLDPATVSELESIVWNTVTTTPGTGVVPEPSTITLLAFAPLLLFLCRRRSAGF